MSDILLRTTPVGKEFRPRQVAHFSEERVLQWQFAESYI
jgi:hypothetical protein